MLEKYKEIFHNKGEVYLRIKARPGSANTGVTSVMDDDTIKIDVAAAPEKGKANTELLRYLSKEFCINKGSILIISGKTDKLKLIKIKL